MTLVATAHTVASGTGHLLGVPGGEAGAKHGFTASKEDGVNVLWLLLVLAVGAYLLYALLRPERF